MSFKILSNTEPLLNLDNESSNQFLTFILGDEEYGVNILQIQEIKGWGNVTTIPNMPNYILGVINLRGTIVPIIDLRRRFKQQEVKYDETTVIIVTKVQDVDHERIVGMVVDAVSEVYDLNDSAMKPSPNFGCNIDVDFISGLANVDEKMIILMNVDKLVSHEMKSHISVAESYQPQETQSNE